MTDKDQRLPRRGKAPPTEGLDMSKRFWITILQACLIVLSGQASEAQTDQKKTDPLWSQLRLVGEVGCRHIDQHLKLLTLEVTAEANTYLAHCEDPLSKKIQATTIHTYFDDWFRVSHSLEMGSAILDVRDDPSLPESALRICKAIDSRAQTVEVRPGDANEIFVLRCNLVIPTASGQYERLQIYEQRVRYVPAPNG
jgi:hypothetical protein